MLNATFEMIQGNSPYKSPTDMGVNMAGFCIVDDEACCEASKLEILRRYYDAQVALKKGGGDTDVVRKLELIMKQAGITSEINPAIGAALLKEKLTGAPAAAMTLPDGRVITGKTSSLLGASAALMLNALKALAGIDKEVDLISPTVIEPITKLKTQNLGHHNPRLHSDEMLVALCVSAVSDPNAALAQKQLEKLRGLNAHFSVIPSAVDEKIYKRLGVNVSCEPVYEVSKLYHK